MAREKTRLETIVMQGTPSILPLRNVSLILGLPHVSPAQLELFKTIWSRMKNYTPQAVTLLVSLVDNVESVELLAKKLKLSNAEKQLGRFIASHRDLRDHADFPVKPYQDILVSSSAKCTEQLRRQVIELLYYKGNSNLVEDIKEWQVPAFPVNGNDLKQYNIKPGPSFGKILNRLKEMWKESYYTLSREELLEKVNGLLQN